MTSGTGEPAVPASDVAEVARLVGDRVVILHGPSEEGLSGRDVDCAVEGLDPWWPLRLDPSWRLCQFSQYDLRGWFWVLEREGALLHLDTIDDPLGVGRDGIPTTLLTREAGEQLSPAARAAYLAIKRLRKSTRTGPEWQRIRDLAAEDWTTFSSLLEVFAGPRLGALLSTSVRKGTPLDDLPWEAARAFQAVRRFRTPRRAAMALALQVRRVLDRLTHTTGWSVLIVGPDGSGKSTLARSFIGDLSGVFRRDASFHWRPGILPRPGAILGRAVPESSTPHARPPHNRVISFALLGYHWLDFLVGGWFRLWAIRVRTGLVVTERGWWDLAVDPRRYRLDVPAWLVRALGAVLPHPDMAFVLEAPPDVVRARKGELPEPEIGRQRLAWRKNLPPGVPSVFLDASLPAEQVVRTTREAALRVLETRAARRLGPGWRAVRHKGQTRWWFPRGTNAAAAEALSIYQPVTPKGRAAWEAARVAARAGAFRLLPRGQAPPRAVREAMAPHLTPRTTLAVARANHRGRYLASIIDAAGSSRGIAKVATDERGWEALRREAEAIRTLGALLRAPLSAPSVIAAEDGVLLLESVPWRPRSQPWRLDEEVAAALGELFRAGAGAGGRGPAHGDFAPWNLLRTARGWVLVDWESATDEAEAFHDLCHYLVQGCTLLRRPAWGEIREGFLRGTGWVGGAVRAYAEGAGLTAAEARGHLASYLRARRESPNGQPRGGAPMELVRRAPVG